MKVLKAILNVLALLIGAGCEWKREAISAGICDYSGQGRTN